MHNSRYYTIHFALGEASMDWRGKADGIQQACEGVQTGEKVDGAGSIYRTIR